MSRKISNSSITQQPVPLLTVQNGKFVIHDEAIAILSSIKGELGVIAVAGLYRTGKSFLLNRLLGRQDGFAIGSTINPCTKGIFVWGKPLTITRNGKEINLVFIDTEGIGSTQQNLTHDTKILSLALLLSSYFIYNSVGIIDEHAIDKLGLVVNITQNISVRAHTGGKEKIDLTELASYFPSFLWVLRDFSLVLEDETTGKEITARQYLENALQEIPGPQQTDKNEIRKKLKQLFVTRDCVTLVRPVNDEKSLQQIDKMPWTSLRPEFRRAMDELQSKVFAEVPIKKVFGKSIDGKGLVTLIHNYVDAINKGSIPTIHTAWESVAHQENQRAIDEATDLFQQHLSELAKNLPYDEDTIRSLKKDKFKIVFEYFDEIAIGENRQKYREKLEQRIQTEWKQFVTRNEQMLTKQRGQLMEQLYHKYIDLKLKNKQFNDIHELVEAWKQMKTEYSTITKGNESAQNAFWNFYFTHTTFSFVQFFDQQKDLVQSKLDHQKKLYDELQHKLLQMEEAKSKFEIQFVTAAKDRERERENNQRLTNEINETKALIGSLKKENSLLKETVERLKDDTQKYQNEKSKLQSNESVLKQQLAQLENEKKQLFQDLKSIEMEKEQLQNTLTQQRQLFSEKEESIHKKIADEKRETTNSIQKLTKEKELLQKQQEKLREEIDEWKRRYNEVEKQKQDMEKQRSTRKKNEEDLIKENRNLLEQIEKFKADARISSQKLQEQFEKREQQLVKELQQAKEENFRIRQQYDKQIATLEYELQQRNQQDTLSKLDNNSLSTCQSSSFDSLREIVDEQNENDNKENSKQNVSFPSKVTRRVTKKTATSKAQIDDEQPQTEERTGQKRKREISEQKTKSEPKEKRQRIENPQKVTKSELKRELTRLGVPLPPKEESKQFYVDLYLAQFE